MNSLARATLTLVMLAWVVAIIITYPRGDTVTLEDGSIVNTSYGAPVDTGD